jgi:branched-chain amino acid transport system ATP-binding protein
MTNPDLILLDEPSEGLAPIVVQEVFRVIEQLKAAGQSILLVEQDFAMAMDVADHAFIMSKGSVVWDGTADELVDNEKVKATYLGVGDEAEGPPPD